MQLLRLFVVVTIVSGFLLAPTSRAQQRFYPDDPLVRFPETQDASGMQERPVSQGYDWVENALLKAGDRSSRRAANVNTLDEVPDSQWFTNRVGTRPMDLPELMRGPNQSEGPAPGPLRITSGKTAGITPGFRMRDSRGDLYFVKFDPRSFPELATAAEVIATKLLYALGYNVPENYVMAITRDRLEISGATVTGVNQRRRPMTAKDLDTLLALAGRQADGTYRILASRALPGTPLGPFRYHGTRRDDPNDIVPHEHRRELRGLRAFAAWINNADSRGVNSLDTLVDVDGRNVVRHHLLDFGSTLGSAGIDQKSRRSGNEYMWDVKRSLVRIPTLGLVVPKWARVRYSTYPGVGRFEASAFVPERWVPHYPNPAFDNARPDDLFWAARRVMALSDAALRAIVSTGQLSNRDAERYLGDTLIARRDAIGHAWITSVNPLVNFTLDADGILRFQNAAVQHGVATPPSEYRVQWAEYDNATDHVTTVGPVHRNREPTSLAPPALLRRSPPFVQAEISTVHDQHGAWLQPVEVYFRATPTGWHTVGIWRLPESLSGGESESDSEGFSGQ